MSDQRLIDRLKLPDDAPERKITLNRVLEKGESFSFDVSEPMVLDPLRQEDFDRDEDLAVQYFGDVALGHERFGIISGAKYQSFKKGPTRAFKIMNRAVPYVLEPGRPLNIEDIFDAWLDEERGQLIVTSLTDAPLIVTGYETPTDPKQV